ncbi:MAG TPA: hypothetical protein VFI29_16485 [Hanamia sp.]|nr:hypothetical protein [Hanamia sp.]
MKEKTTIRYFILIYWTFFEALTVIDKIIPDVYPYWVGADFYTLFVKLFASLGITNPIFATIALAGISSIEIVVLVCYIFSLSNLNKGKHKSSEQWFYRGVSFSVLLFSLFSIGDQVFGERSNLLEHGIFLIMLIVSWVIFKYNAQTEERVIKFSFSKDIKIAFLAGTFLTLLTSYSILDFSKSTFSNKSQPVKGVEVVQGVYKFDFPFLGDKFVFENTIKAFEENNPGLKVDYIYTAPDELNSKKKTHILLYVFTEQKN